MSRRPWTTSPWRVCSAPGGWDAVCEARPSGSIICKLALNHPANAYILAAAPELYEALAAVLDHIVPDNWQDDEDMAAAVRQVIRAMAKARGET